MSLKFFVSLAAACLLVACSGEKANVPDARVILADEPAPKLSDYRLFADAAAKLPAPGVVSYDLVNPLFSDHAAKHRFAYVPQGTAAKYDPEKVFDFPVGSVLIKTFAFAPDMRAPNLGERLIETRLLIRKATGWIAYPYIWNAEGKDAAYSPIGGKTRIETIDEEGNKLSIDYTAPNRNQCKECHQSNGVFEPIGPKARNLNHAGPSGLNELSDWTTRGLLVGAPDPALAPHTPAAFDASAPLGDRARAYLDINCAHCHKAGGGASNSGLFLGWSETDPRGWGVHKRPTAAGAASGVNFFVIEPGQADRSIMVTRMEATTPGLLMPEIGRSTVDRKGVALIRQWIDAMAADD